MKAQEIFERVTAEMANGKSYDEAWQMANAGSSKGAKKGWETKHENHLGLSNIYSKHAEAFTMSAQAHEASAEAARTGSSDWHNIAFDKHNRARRMHEDLGNVHDANRHKLMATEHLNS